MKVTVTDTKHIASNIHVVMVRNNLIVIMVDPPYPH